MPNMEVLRKQRSVIKGKLTVIKNFVTRAAKEVETAPEEITARLQAVEELHCKFQNISQQLLTTEDAPDQRDLAEDSEFDERYYTVKAELLKLLSKIEPRSAGSSVRRSTGDATVMQVLEQQTTLIQRLAERSESDTLVRTMEQQLQLLERLNTHSTIYEVYAGVH